MRDKVGLILLLFVPFFVFGPADINAAKAVYGLSVFLFAIYILVNVDWLSSKFRGIFTSAILLVNLVLVGTLVGVAKNNSFESFGTAFNLLVPALWLITIPYAASKVSDEYFLKIIFFMGLLSSIITVFKWSQLRGYFTFPLDLIAMDSDWNIYLILILFLLQSKQFKKVEKTIFFVTVIFSMLVSFISGTRTFFIIYGYILILCALFAKKQLLHIVTLATSLLFTAIVFKSFIPDALERRYVEFFSRLGSLSFSEALNGFDESTNLRALQRSYFKDLWLENISFGSGIGQSTGQSIVVADTPYAFLAQFGLFGAIYLSLILLFLFKTTIKSIGGIGLEKTKVLTTFFFCLFPITLSYNWTLHKSFWLSLSCLIGYLLMDQDKRQSNKDNDFRRNAKC